MSPPFVLHGRRPSRARFPVGDEVLGLAPVAEAESFELHQEDGGEGVVDQADADVAAVDAEVSEEVIPEHNGRVHDREVGEVVVGCDLGLEQAGDSACLHEDRGVTQVVARARPW